MRAKRRPHDQDSGAEIIPRIKRFGSFRDVFRLLVVSPTLARNAHVDDSETSITRAVDDVPNHLVREWLDAVYVGNDAPRILLARGPATAAAFATRSTPLILFQCLATPFPVHI